MSKKGVSQLGEAAAKASLNGVRVSARKARLVLDLIRGKRVEIAMQLLQHSPKKSARLVEGLLKSAVANAHEKGEYDIDGLRVSACWANEGKPNKRFLPRAQGRATPIRKATAHITLELGV
jgi:large subunit ribosomal protein L22